jgi:hypothetical protein
LGRLRNESSWVFFACWKFLVTLVDRARGGERMKRGKEMGWLRDSFGTFIALSLSVSLSFNSVRTPL